MINRIESGIIVVDEDNLTELMNRAAATLLNIQQSTDEIRLGDASAKLLDIHSEWHNKKSVINYNQDCHLIQRSNQSSLQVRITKAGARVEDRGSVICLTDSSELNRQVQESKLASLGQLTASITHEIRNPLGAISHAAQLLDDSDYLSTDNKRLANIIHDQSKRLNNVIESVLRLSRKDGASLEIILIKPWLEKFLSGSESLIAFQTIGINYNLISKIWQSTLTPTIYTKLFGISVPMLSSM